MFGRNAMLCSEKSPSPTEEFAPPVPHTKVDSAEHMHLPCLFETESASDGTAVGRAAERRRAVVDRAAMLTEINAIAADFVCNHLHAAENRMGFGDVGFSVIFGENSDGVPLTTKRAPVAGDESV